MLVCLQSKIIFREEFLLLEVPIRYLGDFLAFYLFRANYSVNYFTLFGFLVVELLVSGVLF